jgi:hypothetical protein
VCVCVFIPRVNERGPLPRCSCGVTEVSQCCHIDAGVVSR